MLIKCWAAPEWQCRPDKGGDQATADPVRGRHGLGVSSRRERVGVSSIDGVENCYGPVGRSSESLFTVHFGPDFV